MQLPKTLHSEVQQLLRKQKPTPRPAQKTRSLEMTVKPLATNHRQRAARRSLLKKATKSLLAAQVSQLKTAPKARKRVKRQRRTNSFVERAPAGSINTNIAAPKGAKSCQRLEQRSPSQVAFPFAHNGNRQNVNRSSATSAM